jgi:hypothetical protein
MEINTMMIIIFCLLCMFCCSCEQKIQSHKRNSHSKMFLCQKMDSVKLARLGKPDYVDIGYYPLEELTLSLKTGKVTFTQNDSVRYQSIISEAELRQIDSLICRLNSSQINRIYNANSPWQVELELHLYCNEESQNFAIKSFGQHGNNPKELKELYSPLLRMMAGYSSKAGQPNN